MTTTSGDLSALLDAHEQGCRLGDKLPFLRKRVVITGKESLRFFFLYSREIYLSLGVVSIKPKC